MANIPYKITEDRLLYARSFAQDLASLKQTFAAKLVRDLVADIEGLRQELALVKAGRELCVAVDELAAMKIAVSTTSHPEHGGESNGNPVG